MKKLTAGLIMVFLCVQSSVMFAQGVDSGREQAASYPAKWKQHISTSLQHRNYGVVESAIFHVMKFKMMNPQSDTGDLETLVRKLSQSGPTEVIRFKAEIAVLYLENPQLFSHIQSKNYRDNSDELFRELTAGLQKRYLTNY